MWDPCNILYLPGLVDDITQQYASIRKRVIHIHVKDCIRAGGLTGNDASSVSAAPVGLGNVGWRRHLRAIAHGGYQGMLSLETHWRVQPISEQMLHLPGGYGFSQGGEEATRTCLYNLQALLP